ncbi:MAG: insulinase family protein [Nanoarchaeota archaeon]|nr:insulinase family protein [Nanoarchaeota archaeon]MBU4455937.1 insulinase family protein [Nanoarchaeota archaeon]MCG2720368.1 insulinase family protein [Nanoarchaeota archaeon]
MKLEKFVDKALGNELYKAQLSSGMEATLIPLNPAVNRTMVHLYTRFGSIDAKFLDSNLGKEVEVEDGTAHFLEHCAFYDPEGNDALQWFGKKGVSGNAWTSFDHTCYHFSSINENLKRNLDFLISFVTTPFLTDKVVEKEKGVIDQEIAMYEDMPGQVILVNLQKALMKKHAFARSIAGDRNSIRRITKEYLISAYNTFYHPSNLKLVMLIPSESKDAMKYFELAEEINNGKNFSPQKAPEFVYVDEPLEVNQKKIVARHKVPEPLVFMGFKGSMGMDKNADERLRENIVSDLLVKTVFSPSSKAFYELVLKKVIRPNSFEGFSYSGRGFGIFGVNGSIDDEDKFVNGVNEMVKKQVNGEMSKDLFDIVKKASINEMAKVFELESPRSLQSAMIHILASGFNPMNYMSTLLDVTYEDVLEAGKKYLDTDNYAVSVLLPEE